MNKIKETHSGSCAFFIVEKRRKTKGILLTNVIFMYIIILEE